MNKFDKSKRQAKASADVDFVQMIIIAVFIVYFFMGPFNSWFIL